MYLLIYLKCFLCSEAAAGALFIDQLDKTLIDLRNASYNVVPDAVPDVAPDADIVTLGDQFRAVADNIHALAVRYRQRVSELTLRSFLPTRFLKNEFKKMLSMNEKNPRRLATP